MRQFLRSLLVPAFILVGAAGAAAGTGTCTAGPGSTVDGGSCCQAFGQTGCTCNESGSSASGQVSCSHANIKDGSSKVVSQMLKGLGLKANTLPPPQSLQLQTP
jgi:hypothetical protein